MKRKVSVKAGEGERRVGVGYRGGKGTGGTGFVGN